MPKPDNSTNDYCNAVIYFYTDIFSHPNGNKYTQSTDCRNHPYGDHDTHSSADRDSNTSLYSDPSAYSCRF